MLRKIDLSYKSEILFKKINGYQSLFWDLSTFIPQEFSFLDVSMYWKGSHRLVDTPSSICSSVPPLAHNHFCRPAYQLLHVDPKLLSYVHYYFLIYFVYVFATVELVITIISMHVCTPLIGFLEYVFLCIVHLGRWLACIILPWHRPASLLFADTT